MDSPRQAGLRENGRGRWVAVLAIAALLLPLLIVARRAAASRAYVIPSLSMAPTLTPGDRVLAALDAGTPNRGEVWVHRDIVSPGRRAFVKRVIGVPGDRVEVKRGKAFVNGQPLTEPYLAAPMQYTMAPVTVGPDHYFVLGDNRNNSNDSHAFGPVSRRALIGRVTFRYWPPGRAGRIP